MLRQVYQPAGAVFIVAHNVLSQRQVQERVHHRRRERLYVSVWI